MKQMKKEKSNLQNVFKLEEERKRKNSHNQEEPKKQISLLNIM